ncbi:MAG: TolC family protein [Gemmatimonadetes bacterium]|nr:TolC family protein [Gemmatimonadota bacterium]
MNPPLLLTAALAAALGTQDTARLTLDETVERALARYPTVAVARAARDRAAADLADERAARLPRLALEGSVTRFEEPMVVLPLHGFDPRTPPLFDRTLAAAGLFASYTLHDFGHRAFRIRAARSLDGAAEAALSGAEQRLVARAANGYLRVLTARDVLAAQDQRLAALEAESSRVRRLLAEGKAARVQVLRVDAELARARADRIATAAELDLAEHDLAQLAELPFERVHEGRLAALRLAETAPAADALTEDRAALVGRARAASPELLEARRRADAASARLGSARATRFPELRLSSGYVDRGRDEGDFSAEWQVGLSLSYPLYTGGARASAIRRADADARAAAEQLRLAGLTLEQGVDRALAAVREAQARVAALASAVEQSEEVARIERLSLDVGSGTQTDYLDAEASLLRARAGLIEARHAEISARIELARVGGELSPSWLARTVLTADTPNAPAPGRREGEP